MKKWINFLGVCLLFVLWSCNSEPSLQKYYVAHQEDADFMTMDLSTNMIFPNLSGLSEDAKKELKTIQKINILAYPINGENTEKYQQERRKVASILVKGDYHLLVKFTSSKGNFELRYLGTPDAIQEFVVLTYSDDKGFAIARLLGKNMNPTALVKAFTDFDKEDLEVDWSVLEGVFNELN